MDLIATFMRRHPLASFAVLACALSWWSIPLMGTPLSFGVLAAAILVTVIAEGRSGFRTWLRRVGQWRAAPRWYAAALLLPLTIYAAAAGLDVLLGAARPSAAQLGAWPEALLLFPFILVLFGPLGEEPGFQGFALPRLLAGRPALAAGLLLGALRIVWHLPLILNPRHPGNLDRLYLVPLLLAAGILFTWLAHNTGGNVLVAILLHASINTAAEYFAPMFSGADATRLAWLMTAGFVAAALIVVIATSPQRLSRRPVASPAVLPAAHPERAS